jgi:hypothetical protein
VRLAFAPRVSVGRRFRLRQSHGLVRKAAAPKCRHALDRSSVSRRPASFIGPRDPILAESEEWGIDLEARSPSSPMTFGWVPANRDSRKYSPDHAAQ